MKVLIHVVPQHRVENTLGGIVQHLSEILNMKSPNRISKDEGPSKLWFSRPLKPVCLFKWITEAVLVNKLALCYQMFGRRDDDVTEGLRKTVWRLHSLGTCTHGENKLFKEIQHQMKVFFHLVVPSLWTNSTMDTKQLYAWVDLKRVKSDPLLSILSPHSSPTRF